MCDVFEFGQNYKNMADAKMIGIGFDCQRQNIFFNEKQQLLKLCVIELVFKPYIANFTNFNRIITIQWIY